MTAGPEMRPAPPRQAPRPAESKVGLVRGTADVLADGLARLDRLEALLLGRFALAGYRPIRVPILESRALHERKSGARVVANLYQVAGPADEPACLRPEVTAGIVRAFNDLAEPPPLPWRVSYAGPVFRVLPTGPGTLREFRQVGVERIDEAGDGGDAEAIWLADWALASAGIADASIRVGHAGLVRDLLRGSGLPLGVQVALVDVLGEAAQGGDPSAVDEERVLSAAEAHLNTLSAWLGASLETAAPASPDDPGADRLFRTLYPEVVGRRSARDVIGRIRRKWDLGHGLAGVLAKVRGRVAELADLRGPAADVLGRLGRYESVVPSMVRELNGLVGSLRAYGIDPGRVELDLGFGRGIGFYSQMLFVLLAETPTGRVEVCGGGRYDGLPRALGATGDPGGVGFAFGLERLRDALDARGVGPDPAPPPSETLLIAREPDALGLAAWLRAGGVAVVVESAPAGSSSDGDLARSARDRGYARLVVAGGATLRLIEPDGGGGGKATDVGSRDDLRRLLLGDRP